MKKIIIKNEEEMLAFGKTLARVIPIGCVIYLHGDLGAGKTTLVRGVLRGLGYEDKVKSPTYTLVESYHLSECVLYHFDLYRLQDASELQFIGIEEYFNDAAIVLIEWPEKGKQYLPSADVECFIDFDHESRVLHFIAHTEKGQIM